MGHGYVFVAICAVDRLLSDEGAALWPLIPGRVVTVVGASRIAAIHDIGICLVAVALIVVAGSLLLPPSRYRREPSPGQWPSTPAGSEREE